MSHNTTSLKSTNLHIPPFTRAVIVQNVSIPEIISEAQHYLSHLKQNGIALHVDEYFYALTLDETISNAVNHGNLHAPDKRVIIEIGPCKGKLKITVKDEGHGFDPSHVPDPLSPENRCRRGGRGLHILRNLARVRWNREGNCIVVKL
jgi:anti-sigma regulatory factor (Ser/Thr protein kinase)